MLQVLVSLVLLLSGRSRILREAYLTDRAASWAAGHYLVEEALKAGLLVIATARNLDSIRDLEKLGATILELDLTSSEASITEFAKKAIAVQ